MLATLFSAALPILIASSGLYLLIRTRAFLFLHPIRSLRYMLGGDRLSRSLSSLALALSGTLGVGSVSGVILALSVGGPGAILWMWISAILSIALHYVEVAAALTDRLPCSSVRGRLHAALLVLTAPLLGGALQSAAAAEALTLTVGAPRISVGLLLSFALLAAAMLGVGRLSRLTERLLPILSLLYLILTLGVIVGRIERLPEVLTAIVGQGFSPKAASGGLLGCIWIGFSRGLLSNEAGCGTAVYAHAEAGEVEPCRQGLFGAAEVAIDTLLFCTLTAFALLLAADGGEPTLSTLLSAAVESLGPIASPLLSLTLTIFAYAAALALLHHGRVALSRLGIKRGGIYTLLFCASLAVGSLFPSEGVAALLDPLLLALTALTLPGIVKAADRVVSLSAAAGLIRFTRKRGSSTAGMHPMPQDARACQAPRARS